MNSGQAEQSSTTREAAAERRNINCRISVEAYDTWRAFCTQYGTSLTALLEAIAFEYRQLVGEEELDPIERAIVERARRIDAERRARSPKND